MRTRNHNYELKKNISDEMYYGVRLVPTNEVDSTLADEYADDYLYYNQGEVKEIIKNRSHGTRYVLTSMVRHIEKITEEGNFEGI